MANSPLFGGNRYMYNRGSNSIRPMLKIWLLKPLRWFCDVWNGRGWLPVGDNWMFLLARTATQCVQQLIQQVGEGSSAVSGPPGKCGSQLTHGHRDSTTSVSGLLSTCSVLDRIQVNISAQVAVWNSRQLGCWQCTLQLVYLWKLQFSFKVVHLLSVIY